MAKQIPDGKIYFSDEEVFGSPDTQQIYFSDEEVFGVPAPKKKRRDVPDMTVGSVAQDIASGVLQIVPTAVKGVADIARMATGDSVGTDTSNRMERDMETIRKDYGSDRAAAQRENFQADMTDDSVGIGEALGRNKGALADQLLPTIGSMFLPVGVAGAAGKLATVGKAAQAMDKATLVARVASAQQAAGIGAVAAQNAADTFAQLLEKGAPMEDAYLGAGITVPFSVIAGRLTGGGAEGAITRALTGSAAAKAGVKQLGTAMLKEGGQEMGEEAGQITGEAVAMGEAPSVMGAAKQMAVAGTLGAAMGGGVDVATQSGKFGKPGDAPAVQPPAITPETGNAPADQAPPAAVITPQSGTADPTTLLAKFELLAEQRDLTTEERAQVVDLLTTLDQQEATGDTNQATPVQPGSQAPDAGAAPVDAAQQGATVGPAGPGATDVAGQSEQTQPLSDSVATIEQSSPDPARWSQEQQQRTVRGSAGDNQVGVDGIDKPDTTQGLDSIFSDAGAQSTQPNGQLATQNATLPTVKQDLTVAPPQPTQPAPTDFWSFAKAKGFTPGQITIGSPEHAALKAEYDALKAGNAAPVLPPMQPQQNVDLQNRDRGRAASVVQMSEIARNPDYMRLGPSRTPDSGAPMVFAVGDQLSIAPQNMGREDVAVMSDGQRVPFRYAVVDASTVNPSNFADGRQNPAFASTTPGTLKALNNGRTAGVRAAHEMGTAADYVGGMKADEAMHGIPADVIARTPNPMLVRVYADADNTAGMAAKSQGQGLGMSPAELARQDAPMLDSSVLGVYADGEVASAGNRDFVRAFIGKLQGAGQDVAGMMTGDGQLSQDGRKRIQAALMQAAYGDSNIIEEMFDSTDTDIKAIGEALKAVAGRWANMRDSARLGAISPGVDITQNLLQAIGLIRKARRDNTGLFDLVNQPDLMTGETPDAMTVGMLRMFYSGKYLTRAIGKDKLAQYLGDYMTGAMATSADAGMFGDVVTPADILATIINRITQGQGNAETQPQESREQPAGGITAGRGVGEGGQAVGRPGAAEGRAGSDQDSGSQPGQDAQAGTEQQAGQGDQGAEKGDGSTEWRTGPGQQTGADGQATSAAGRAAEAERSAVKRARSESENSGSNGQVTEPGAEYSVRQQFPLFGSEQSDQLQLILDSGPVPVQAGPGAVAAQREAVAALADLQSTASILAAALTGDYAARQRVSLVGQTVNSAEDLAVLAQVYRDPRFETFRAIFVDANRKVVSQLGLTSRLPASAVAIMGDDTKAYLDDLMATAKKAGAVGYYLLHNHPSGHARPSGADVSLTRTFAMGTPGMQMMSHVVIDTNEYSVIDGAGNAELKKKDFGQPAPLGGSNVTFNNPGDVVAYAKQVQADAGAVTLIATDTQYKVKGVTTLPAAALNGDKGLVRLRVVRALMKMNASNVFAVGRETGALAKLSGIVVDAIHIEPSGKASSMVERGMMNVATQGAFPKDRRTRVTADSSPEFAYLRFNPSELKSAGQRVAEGDLFSPSANAWQSDLFGAPEPTPAPAPEQPKPKTEKEARTQRAEKPAQPVEQTSTPKPKTEKEAKAQREAPTPAKPAAVENFGEALPPARRAMAAKLNEDLTDDKIASMPLSQIWPATENDAIEDTFAAAVAHVMREAIPAKPRTPYKVKSWVGKVRLLRGFAADIMGGKFTKEKFITETAKVYALKDMLSKIKLLEQIDRADWARIGDVSEAPNAVRYEDNKQVPTPSVSVTVDGRSHWLRGSGDVADHLDGIKSMLGTAAPDSKMQFEIRQESGGARKVFINKKGDKEYRRLMTFDTVAEARAAIQNQYADLVASWDGVKARDNITERDVRSDVNRDRTGKDHRQGKDVSAEDFESRLGFRGGEFGAWVKQGDSAKERQFLLNNAYDALMDLSDLLGIPPKAISLEGTLGIAFGSRGAGAAAAHFEPSNLVINLTKTRGAGSLAHEWFHALDNYFARKRGGEVPMDAAGQVGYRNNNYITHKTTPLMVRKDGRGSPLTKERLAQWRSQSPNSGYLAEDQWHADPKHKDGVRVEVERAFNDLVAALNASPMLKRARVLDGVKENGDGYWSRTLEMAARSFENFVQTRMMEQGYHNDFLANVKAAPDVGKNTERYPYLMPNEIAPIANAFDGLFGVIQAKETADGNISLLSRGTATGGVEPEALESLVDDIRTKNPNLPKVNVLADPSQAPRGLREYIERQGAMADVEGAMHDGELYLFASGLSDLARAEHVLIQHEAAHYGLRAILGDKLKTAMNLVYANNGNVRKAATELQKRGKLTNAEAVEEVIVDIPTSELAKLTGWRKVVAMASEWAGARGYDRTAQKLADWLDGSLSDQQRADLYVAELVKGARDYVAGKRPGAMDIGGTRLATSNSKQINPDNREQTETPEFKRWFGDWEIARLNGNLNSAIEQWSAGALPTGEILQIGRPSGVLRQFGIPDLPIHLTQRILAKAVKQKHDVNIGDLKDLALNIQAPLAVFQSKRGPNHRVIVTEARHADGNVIVALELEKTRDGLEVNDITSIHPKRDGSVATWVADGMLMGYEKSKGRKWLENSAGSNSQQPQAITALDNAIVYETGTVRNPSKVVDADGNPLVMYHGSGLSIFEFFSHRGKLIYFSTDIGTAESYAKYADENQREQGNYDDDFGRNSEDGGAAVYPVYLSVQNPFDPDNAAHLTKLPESIAKEIKRTKGDYDTIEQYQGDIEAAGFDGVYVREHAEQDASERRDIAVFSPTQIKSAIGNNGNFDPANPDIRLSRATLGGQPPQQPGPQNAWQKLKAKALQLSSPESITNLIYELQDKNIDLKNLREHIKALGGTITDLNDAYLGEELYHKRVAKRTQDFLSEELKPLLADLRARGLDLATLERYLHARHAPEANRVLAERNPNAQMIDAGKTKAAADVKALEVQLQRAKAQGIATKAIEQALDMAREELSRWTGVQAFKGTEDERLSLSGMSDAEAASVVANLPAGQAVHLDALAARVDAMNAKTLDTLEKYGLMEKTALDTWRTTYQHYVPLHRDEAHPDSVGHPVGQGFSTKGDASKRRAGSNEKVTNILAHIAMQREAALTRGEKNRVAKKLYLMAAQNPDPEVWTVDKPPMIKTVDRETGFVRSSVDPTYRNKANVVMMRIGGRDHAIVFNERNPLAVRMAESIKGADLGDLNAFDSLMGKATRWLASVNTQYNPIFGIINFTRDVQAALLQLSSTPLAGQERAVASYMLPALKGVYTELRSRRAGQGRGTGEWAKLWEDMQDEGGTTGFRELFVQPDERVKALEKELASLDRGQASQAAHAVVDWLSDYNETMENATRLAAYKVAFDNGMSKERAASVAKNITVNFNRKGRQTAKLGAYYAFLNAAIQGTTRMVETLKGPAGRKIMAGGVALGAINTLLAMVVMGAGGDDDQWEKIPSFVKERSLIIPLGREDYLAIPMPLGFHVLPNIGRKSVEMMMHNDPTKGAGTHFAEMLRLVLDSFNPLGGSSNLAQMITPTPFDPAVALMQNRDWTGKQIYREDMSNLDPTPGHTRTKDSASIISKGIAEALGKISGGTNYQPGAINWTPDQIDFVIGQLTGGVGREALKLLQVAESPFTGDELPPHKIPLLGRVYGNTRGPSSESEKFYENVTKLNGVEREMKGLAREGADYSAYRDGEPLSGLAGLGDAAQNQISKLRQARKEVIRRGEPGYQDEVKALNESIGEVMKNLNQEVRRTKMEATQ